MIQLMDDFEELRARITVIGVGGAGGNAVAKMMRNNAQGVDFVFANTDAQALQASPAGRILQLGRKTTGGLGAGSQAELGRAAAEESLLEIGEVLVGAHMCFIAAGLGGGTGSGAAPVIAKAARDKGILTVGVVTKPFAFEGTRRAKIADLALEELERHVDTLIVIPNQNLFRIANPETTIRAAFDLADDVLQQGVRGITDLITMPGMINLDFADIRTVMVNRGKAMMGSGEAKGENRAIRAVEQAISNPLLDDAMAGAHGLIISISGGGDLGLMEVDEVAHHIKDMVDPEADIIWGSAFDAALEGRIRVSVVATGIDAVREVQTETLRPQPTAASDSAAGIAALRPIEVYPAPAQFGPDLDRAVEDDEGELSGGELLLTVERILTLVPPEDVEEMPTLDPFVIGVEPLIAPVRGASLFERMAQLARHPLREWPKVSDPPRHPLIRSGRGVDGRIAQNA